LRISHRGPEGASGLLEPLAEVRARMVEARSLSGLVFCRAFASSAPRAPRRGGAAGLAAILWASGRDSPSRTPAAPRSRPPVSGVGTSRSGMTSSSFRSSSARKVEDLIAQGRDLLGRRRLRNIFFGVHGASVLGSQALHFGLELGVANWISQLLTFRARPSRTNSRYARRTDGIHHIFDAQLARQNDVAHGAKVREFRADKS